MSIYEGKKILITGAGGFVGSVLLRKIITDYPDAEPFIFLRKTTNTWRIRDLFKKVKVLQVDLVDASTVKRQVKKIKPDIIFHLAAYGGYPQQSSLQEAVKTNILGTQNLLLGLEDINYQLLVNTGSSSEYGHKRHLMRETDVLEPASFYAATKASATLIANTYGELTNRPIVTLRLFSVYGPYEEPGRFIPTVILNAIKGRKIDVVGGKQKRDFVYVDDVVDAYLVCLNLKNFNQRVFNICTGVQISIEQAARIIVKLTRSKSQIEIGTYPARPWDTNYWVGRNSLAQKVLKWKPKYPLSSGLSKSIEWFRENGSFNEKN